MLIGSGGARLSLFFPKGWKPPFLKHSVAREYLLVGEGASSWWFWRVDGGLSVLAW